MKIPRYWARSESDGDFHSRNPQTGERLPFVCWGWSDLSLDEAREVATRRLHRLIERVRAGHKGKLYPYGSGRPLKEEILEEWERDGAPHVLRTRNSYGCEVLNTADILFVDVDVEPLSGSEAWGLWWARLRHRFFGGSAPQSPVDFRVRAALSKLRDVVSRDHRMRVRVYRTFAGFRYLFTHDHHDPTAETVHQLMEELGADAMYRRLCKTQECFRARVSPKPWRVRGRGDHGALWVQWPPQDESQAKERLEWIQGYELLAATYATCRFVEELGETPVPPDIAELVDLHDRLSRADSDRPLA